MEGDRVRTAIRSFQKLYAYHKDKNASTAYCLAKADMDRGHLKGSVVVYCYMHGLEVQSDPKKVVEFWTEAAKAGSFFIFTDLSQCYKEDLVPKWIWIRLLNFTKKDPIEQTIPRSMYELCLTMA